MSDLELPIRGRTYREPEGAHSVVVRGRDLDAALQHAAARDDCRAVAVIGLPAQDPDLTVMKGRRLFLVDADGSRLRDFAEIALRADADVEWIRSATPPFDRLADALLPVGAVVLAAGSSTRMAGSEKLLLEFGGRPMIKSVIEAASDGGCHQILVVYSSNEVMQAVGRDAELVHNPHAQTGMASSLQVGLRALRSDMEAAMVMLGDQPMVGSRTVSALLRAWRRRWCWRASFGTSSWRSKATPVRARCSITGPSWSTPCPRSTALTTSIRRRTTPRSSSSSPDPTRLRKRRGASLEVDGRLVAWVALSALLIATPGPDTALIIRNALGAGPRASTMSALGVAAGILVWVAASAVGVGLLLERSSTAFTILKLAGAAYLCYLGFRSLLSKQPAEVGAPSVAKLNDRSALSQGLFSNLLNPKTGAFFVTVMPQFTIPGDPAIRLLLMVAAFEVMLLAWLIAYGHVVSRLGRSGLGTGVRQVMTRLTGLVLIGLGARLAFERR